MYHIDGNRPADGDKFYNTVGNGGYSQCIQGKPVIDGLNVLCNCVGAACGFFNKIYSDVTGYTGMKYPYLNCNAENFISRAKAYYPDIKIVQEPTEGGIMVWEGIGDLAGHVAGVVRCNSETQVYTAESGYNSFAWGNYTRNKGANGNYGLNTNSYRYLGCLVNPALGEQRSYKEEKPIELKYKVGDKVIFTGILYADAMGGGAGQYRKDLVCTITMVYDKPGTTKPYNIDNGLGWVAQDDLTPYTEPEKPVDTEIKLGDTVIVNGVGTASSTGEGARTRHFTNQEMKVIMISGNTSRPNRYALNQYNKGTVNDPSAVTAWFSINDIKK